MGTKDYRYEHKLPLDEANRRTHAELTELAKKYGLKLLVEGEQAFRLEGAGVDADVKLSATDLTIRLSLGFLIEKALRSRIEKTLDERMAGMLA